MLAAMHQRDWAGVLRERSRCMMSPCALRVRIGKKNYELETKRRSLHGSLNEEERPVMGRLHLFRLCFPKGGW
jgi:hypothetical protein